MSPPKTLFGSFRCIYTTRIRDLGAAAKISWSRNAASRFSNVPPHSHAAAMQKV